MNLERYRQGAISTLLVGALILMAACTSNTKPPPQDFPDAVTASDVQREDIVGRWTATERNPASGQSARTSIIEYFADGTVKGLMRLAGPTDAQALTFEVTGGWIVNGNVISHNEIKMNSTTDNEAAQRISMLVNSQRGISGVARIVELTNERMVMVGTDGVAMEYIRQ